MDVATIGAGHHWGSQVVAVRCAGCKRLRCAPHATTMLVSCCELCPASQQPAPLPYTGTTPKRFITHHSPLFITTPMKTALAIYPRTPHSLRPSQPRPYACMLYTNPTKSEHPWRPALPNCSKESLRHAVCRLLQTCSYIIVPLGNCFCQRCTQAPHQQEQQLDQPPQ